MRIPPRTLLRNPACFMALGAGTGLAPRAPGTFGTLIGIPLLFLMPHHVGLNLLVIAILFAIGVWCCDVCAKELGVHDHPGIVWDEVVGYLLVMVAVPRTILFIVLGFILFRFFDILKPWPIRIIDQNVHGGFGIMVDDVVAAVFAAIVLQIIVLVIGA